MCGVFCQLSRTRSAHSETTLNLLRTSVPPKIAVRHLEAFKLLKGTLLFLKTVYLFLILNVYILRLYSASSSISLQIYKSTSFLSLIFSSPFPQIIAATTEYRWHGNTPRSQDLAKIRRSFMLLWRLMPDVKLAYIIPVPGICSLG